jgi:hypothetical protein
VVIGGIAVNLLGVVRLTDDVDVLVPATPQQGEAIRTLLERLQATRPDGDPLPEILFDGVHHIRARTRYGVVDFVPEGEAPLDYRGVHEAAQMSELHGVLVPRAGLAHLAALKRLAGRPIDHQDLERLEAAYGELPILELPGIND